MDSVLSSPQILAKKSNLVYDRGNINGGESYGENFQFYN